MAAAELQPLPLAEEVRDEMIEESSVEKKRNYPIFMVSLTLLQIGLFIYDHICITREGRSFGWDDNSNYFPVDHPLILNRDKQVQIWRFYTHAFVHAGGQHLFFNMLLQIVTGIPLEIESGSLRVGLVHTLGVLVANLPMAFLGRFNYGCGGSGGSYCIAAAKLAVVLSSLNKRFEPDQRGRSSGKSEDYEANNGGGLSSKSEDESAHFEVAQEGQVCDVLNEPTAVDSGQREQVNVKVETGNSIFRCAIWVLVILCMTVGVELFTTYLCYASGSPYWYYCRAHFAHLTASLEGVFLGLVFLNKDRAEVCGKRWLTRLLRGAALAIPILTIAALAFSVTSKCASKHRGENISLYAAVFKC
jgi:hypothetical protein